MDADRRRVGDHLILKARVELHVAGLVDLLGSEEGRFLLAAVGPDQPRELGRDPLLGDHQRGEHPEDQAAVLAAQLLPLLGIGGEVDLERAPLAFLPVAVELLGAEQVDLGHDRSRACGRG